MRNHLPQRSKLKGCLIALLLIIGLSLLSCGFLVETTTPPSTWLYQHNYYFQDIVDGIHGHH